MNYIEQFFSLSLVQQVLFWTLVGTVFIQLFYYIFFYLRIAFHKEDDVITKLPPVSVIVCSRNEEKNLLQLIPVLMTQDYPEFQLVVVDDQSWDSSPEILSSFKVTYPDLHVVELSEGVVKMQGKKFALSMGIKAAKFDQLLLIDADCMPASSQWVKNMMTPVDKEIVLGYSPYEKRKGLLNAIIRFDTFMVAQQYLSFAKAGMPYMGVGRNLAYKKELFYENGGFKKHIKLASGDDDLFINEVANSKNTTIRISKPSHVLSYPKTKWKDWVYQKRRHLTTAPHYKFKHKFLLGLYPLVYIGFIVSGVALLILQTLPLLVISIIAFRFLLQLITFISSSKYLGERKLAWMSPVLELALMTLNPLIYVLNLINKPREWN